ncbi:hypothetical protein V8G54_017063 [Vigna mungo]|uniref:Retrovirus-related Pol polyprotein from transposon TNT 1-94 n=1 Tax=Vigna mungo TaxID=3915 RepID=A0AAQ3NQA3_VIGMU
MASLPLLTKTKIRCSSHGLDPKFRGFEHCPESSSLQDCKAQCGLICRRFIVKIMQDSLSISDFYSQFMNLWVEYTDIVYANLSSEGIRSNLMHIDPVPSLDACLNELLREEQRLLTQSIIEDQRLSTVPVAYVAQGKSRRHDMSIIQCFSCKRFGHYASTCPKSFATTECPIRPPRRPTTTFSTTTISSIPNSSVNPTPVHPNATTDAPTLTPEMVQQIIISAFSALGLSGNSFSPWYFDYGASNHMTNNARFLTNIKNYSGNLTIHTAGGNQLPITETGDISPFLTNVFVAPGFTSNIISAGQLVDNDCRVQFSQSGCFVQDQHSGKIIAMGPKVGRLFPIHFSLSPSFSLPLVSCNSAVVDHQVWHKRLGHPNSNVLHDMFKSEFLQSNGILSQRSCPSTPQQNGLAKRKNRHLLDVVRTLLLESHVPSRFWCEALSTAVHLINRLSSPSISNESPFTRLFGHPPDYFTLRIFGCACYVHLPPHERTKLTAICCMSSHGPLQDTSLDVDPVQAPEPEPAPLRRKRYICSMTATLSSIPIPSSYKQAMQNECWKKAIESELLALEENQTWDIMPCPPSVKPLGSKFVFSIKLRSDGSIDRYKARLVVLRNKQEYGLDYDETFFL